MLFQKYEPKTIDKFIGSKSQVSDIVNYIKNNDTKKALMIHGPPGCGKSLCVKLAARMLGYELMEIHTSDGISKKIVEKMVESSKQASLFYRGKIILIDDADTISGRYVSELLKSIGCPLVIVATNAYDRKLSSVRRYCRLVKFDKAKYTEISDILKKVCMKEGYTYNESAINQIARMSDGDIRSALIDLEVLGPEINNESLKELGYREREDDIFNIMRIIFKSFQVDFVRNSSHKNPDEIFLWLEENIQHEYKDMEEIASAYEYLAKADIFSSRILRRQAWSLQKYFFDFSVLGVALSKKNIRKNFVMYKLPKFYYTKNRTSVAKKISKKLHVSQRKSIDCINLIGMLVKKDKELALKLGLDRDDIKSII